MDENYYLPVSHNILDTFMNKFDTYIYSNLKSEGKSKEYIFWRSAAYLVDDLRSPDDKISRFFPPEPAKEFKQEVLGIRIDLGIEGFQIPLGYLVTRIEPRSDAYIQGLREKDIIIKIGDKILENLDQEEIVTLLTPLIDTKVALVYRDFETQEERTIDVLSQDYFQQTVFMETVPVPGIYCLEIRRFNRKTSEDLARFLTYILQKGNPRGLILDLRGNPGGPPLAAEEISGFFLPPQEELAYFQKKNQPQSMLKVPQVPDTFRYAGPLAILVNKESGSSSELFSGVLQKKGRAVLLGTNTAGQVFLKSMFNFEDHSMVLLVTARGHFPDGGIFSFDGITPNQYIEGKEEDLLSIAANYLLVMESIQKNASEKAAALYQL